jgi:hypothetical protein
MNKNLTINQKVTLDLEAIKGTKYELQLFGFNNRTVVIVTNVLDFHKTFSFKPTDKSKIEATLPIRFIKEGA